MKKLTAVEWYAEQGMKLEISRLKGEISTEKMFDLLFEKLQKAKEMEKEQMKDSYKKGFAYRDTWNWELNVDWDEDSTKENENEFEQYYNETFKSE